VRRRARRGHWVAEENLDYFCRMFIEFDKPEPEAESAEPLTHPKLF
jgi:hypothetical protein